MPNNSTEKLAFKPKKNQTYLPNGNLKSRPVEQAAFPPAPPAPFFEPHNADTEQAINARAQLARKQGLRGGALINWVASGRWLRSQVKRYLKT